MTRAWRVSRGAWMAAASLVWALASSPASAQNADAKRALELGYEADALFARGKWQECHDRFKAADDLLHSPVFVLYMARCKRNAGELLAAREIYARVAAEWIEPTAPKPFRQAVADAGKELEELRARIPTVRIRITGREARGVEVSVDGKVVAIADPIPLDPGTHEIVARAKGAEAKRAIDLAERGGEKLVELELSESAAVPPPRESRGSLVPGILGLTLGALGLELGAITGGLAASKAGAVKEGCVGNHCLRADAEDLDLARTLATVSTVGFVVGGACVVTGAVLVALRPGDGAEATVSVTPTGLVLGGRF